MKTYTTIKMLILFLLLLLLGVTASAQDAPLALPEGDAPEAVLQVNEETRGGGGGGLFVTLNAPVQGEIVSMHPKNVLKWTWSAQVVDKFVIKLTDLQTNEIIKFSPKPQELICNDNGAGGLSCQYVLVYDTLKLLKDNHQYLWNVTAKATFGDAEPIKSKSDSWMFTADLIKEIIMLYPDDGMITSATLIGWFVKSANDVYRVKVKNVATGELVMNSISGAFCQEIDPQNHPDLFQCMDSFSGLELGNTYKFWIVTSNQYGKSKSMKNTFTYDIIEIVVP